jgi:lipoprotein-anchoring transpeptidase ErfK/SrfK
MTWMRRNKLPFQKTIKIWIIFILPLFLLIPIAHAREIVPFDVRAQVGTIVIKLQSRKLYFITQTGEALRYSVAVGKSGKQWKGWARIEGKFVNPDWSPPADVKRDIPSLPDVIKGGSPKNPMGVRAMTLDRGQYAIHGTNRPESIGTAASYGCIRMHNHDIVDLFERVQVGTPIVVLQ